MEGESRVEGESKRTRSSGEGGGREKEGEIEAQRVQERVEGESSWWRGWLRVRVEGGGRE